VDALGKFDKKKEEGATKILKIMFKIIFVAQDLAIHCMFGLGGNGLKHDTLGIVIPISIFGRLGYLAFYSHLETSDAVFCLHRNAGRKWKYCGYAWYFMGTLDSPIIASFTEGATAMLLDFPSNELPVEKRMRDVDDRFININAFPSFHCHLFLRGFTLK